MCGITGILQADPSRPVDRELLARMNQCLVHRGPDSDGFYLNGQVGLAMRRLAIVDLVSGGQPMSNETGDVWIVFNGEIFNFPELRPALEKMGHTFRTNSDTEAIVHLYEEYGADCVQHLRGQFAFAIWDAARRRLLLARDRLGQLPLYYAQHGGAFYFGSELKTILRAPGIPRTPHLPALDHYLTLQYVPDPWTAFEGIHKLPPAHTLLIENQKLKIEKYWDLDYEPKWHEPAADLRARLRAEITAAVRIRLMSDVPLGAHLSGGVDSTIVTGLMAGMLSQPVKTFSIGFGEEHFNELPHARQVAARFGTEHHEFIVQPDALDTLFAITRHFDEPLADPAALPTWHLARMTRQHVTVALNGDGGDEAFAGYKRYYGDRYADLYRAIPGFLRRGLLTPLIARLPSGADRPHALPAALRGMARGAEVPHSASKVRWSEHFNEAEKRALLATPFLKRTPSQTPEETHTAAFHSANARHRIDRTLYTDLHHYLPGALLPKADRMTMAHSLEARSPFLDHQVMELAARLPVNWKIRGRTTKWILRDLFQDLFPAKLETRGKTGFGVPLGLWFRTALHEPARELLLSGDARSREYFRPQQVARLLEENRTAKADHGRRIWTLLALEIWMREYL
jgi:asparagine synthase (glutamine-hydrolysing)